jgi:hypothetical protein
MYFIYSIYMNINGHYSSVEHKFITHSFPEEAEMIVSSMSDVAFHEIVYFNIVSKYSTSNDMNKKIQASVMYLQHIYTILEFIMYY